MRFWSGFFFFFCGFLLWGVAVCCADSRNPSAAPAATFPGVGVCSAAFDANGGDVISGLQCGPQLANEANDSQITLQLVSAFF